MPDGELIHVDPVELLVGVNVRADAKPDPELVASIKQRGVLEPIVGYLNDDGQVVVVHGQRRTLAACVAGVADVPVWVRDEPLEPDRLVDQVVENDQRAALAYTDRLAAYEQLSALGVSAAQIAKRTSTPRPTVDAALAAAKSVPARAAIAEHGLTIEQAAAVAEFEHRPDVVERLTRAAATGFFDHEVQAARDFEEENTARDLKATEVGAAGVPVHDRIPIGARWFDGLTDADGQPLTADAHAGCPGHAAVVTADREWADDAGDDDPGTVVVSVDYVCTQPSKHGLPGMGKATGQPAADPDREAREAREAAERDKRRTVIANNKAWRSAQTVRRDWLRKLAARKTPPKGGAAFLAATLAWVPTELVGAVQDRTSLGHELLDLAPGEWRKRGEPVQAHLLAATEARATLVALVLVLGALESKVSPDGWRYHSDGTRRYLRWLAEQGYQLSAVECLAAGLEPPADDGSDDG